MAQLREEQLLKALSDMETFAKGGKDVSSMGNKPPTTTAQANGGLSDEGDQTELAVTDKSPSFATKSERRASLEEWAEKGMKGKPPAAKDDDDSEDDDESSYDESSGDESTDETTKSTISDLLKSDVNAGPVIDVAPFIESLVDNVSEAINELRKSVDALNARLGGQQRVLKALGNLTMETREDLAGIMDQPVGGRRSVVSKSEVQERFEDSRPAFSKSQTLDTMVELCRMGKVTPIDVSRYEATDTMESNVRKAVEDELRKSA